jgi:hypothetical protein
MKISRNPVYTVIDPQNNLKENPFSVSPDLTPDHNLHKLIRKLIRRKQSIFRNREFLDFNNLDLTPLANYKHLNFWEFAKSRNLIDSKIECINFSGSNLTGLDLSIPSANLLACNFDFELGSANDTKFFTELACEKYSQGSNLKRLLQFLEFINKTSILNTPYDNTLLIHLAKSLNPNSLKLQDLVDEITSGITDTRVKKFMSLVCSNYLFRFYVTDKFLRRLFPD